MAKTLTGPHFHFLLLSHVPSHTIRFTSNIPFTAHCTSIDVLQQQVKLLDALQAGGRSIDLTACRLRGLPNLVAFHHTLVHLDLSWNYLTVSNNLKALHRIISTHFRTVYIHTSPELPGSLENMTRMEILTLRSNPLRHVPLSVAKLRCLRQLDLSHCLLSDLPYE
ncbi:hypothetical protein FGIG_02580 [Fasciola gigantica]|uniref:Uncharacterized protein n=1 Tax=Fasciola gigantica TaxID=46835 RepID=A0A504Y9T3_FASGI|nr:hypothetical protein FGIG_02580 [Fasciola gigantica]